MIKSTTMDLDDYLSIKNGTFLIPFVQRNYEWGKKEVKRLFNDLMSLYQADNNHILNFFTFSKNDVNVNEIYDGQQRTVTILLLIAVIMQKMYKDDKYNEEILNDITQQYFFKKDVRHNNNDLRKIDFNDNKINDLFDEITAQDFQYDSNSFDMKYKNFSKNSSAKYLVENYNLLNNLLDEFLDQKNKLGIDINLLDLINDITDKSILITLETKDQSVAINMFESLNNTGKDLEKYYVLKNNIEKRLHSDNARNKWREVDDNLSNITPSKFLIALATDLSGKTNKVNVLENIYKVYAEDDKDKMYSLLDLLETASKKYLYICKPEQLLIDKNTSKKDIVYEEYKKLSEYIDVFGTKQHFPILLALMIKEKPIEDINKFLKTIFAFSVINIYFGNMSGNKFEKDFATYAMDIFQEKMSIDNLISEIYKKISEKSKAIEDIKIKENKTNTSVNRIKLLLKLIYNHNMNQEININDKKVDLEHILPRNPKENSEWIQNFNKDEIESYKYRIGNLTLWLDSSNRSSKNDEFKNKKERYKDSPLEENKEIAKCSEWNADSIDKRSTNLGNKILQYFNL